MGPKVEFYCTEPCLPWSTCQASPIRWRTINGCSKNARVVLWWVGSRKMSEQTKSSLCDNWGDWGLTCSTPHFFGDMRRIWNMYYRAKTPLVKCIETSTGGHGHPPRVSSVKKYREYRPSHDKIPLKVGWWRGLGHAYQILFHRSYFWRYRRVPKFSKGSREPSCIHLGIYFSSAERASHNVFAHTI